MPGCDTISQIPTKELDSFTMQTKPQYDPTGNARVALFWSILGGIGTGLAFPHTLELNPGILEQVDMAIPALAAVQVFQTSFILLVAGWAAFRTGETFGLDSPVVRSLVRRTKSHAFKSGKVLRAIGIGVGIGLLSKVLDLLAFSPLLPEAKKSVQPDVSLWKSLLATFQEGITDELLMRLLLMTFMVWLLRTFFFRSAGDPPKQLFHTAIVVSALLIAVGHLPTASSVWDLTPLVVIRVLLLSMIESVPYGFLFWRWGLEYAVIAHLFTAVTLTLIGAM